MDSGLKLRVSKYLMGTDIPRNGVIANIYALDPDKSQNSKRNLVIPVGYGARYETVNLEPGNYLVEALLPSGDILSQEAATKEGQFPEVDLQGEHSAHEWHSLHNLLGNVEAGDSYYRSYDRVKEWSSLDVWALRNPPPELRSGTPEGSRAWQSLVKWTAKGSAQAMDDIGPSLEVSLPNDRDGATQVHSFRMGAEHLPKEQLPRWYALAKSVKALQLVSVPAPWFNLDNSHELPVELLVRQSEGGDLEASFSVPDLDLSTALGYMSRGALQAAAHLVDQADAVNMLFLKWTNPLGAAGGAYILLGTQPLTDTRPWHEWVRNLMNHFPWLPDGAIQYAWLQLRQGSSPENRRRAREALIKAFSRGIPYYTLGLQWMIDGLTLLGEDDKEAQRMLRSVQQVTWRADMSQTFTSIGLAR